MKRIYFIIALLLSAGSASAVIPISGRPVPTMTAIDDVMTDYMEEWDIEAGVVGIMYQNRVVYLRGFGSMDAGVNMPENAMIRQASATKPATAAAIRMLADGGAFGAGGLSRKVFKLSINGVSNNGLLDLAPFPSLVDTRLANITLQHLLEHKGGFFPRDPSTGGPGDPVFLCREIAGDMNVASPPSRTNVIRWMLGKAIRDTPGTTYEYSNFGYLVLGEIIQSVSGQSYTDYLHTHVFTPSMWVPRSELEGARTLRDDRNAREPWYRATGTWPSVFDNTSPIEQLPIEYGGYSLPTLIAHGGLVASAPAMLALGNAYHLGYPDIGEANTLINPTGTQSHGGALFGVLTFIDHRSDGVVIYGAVNRRFAGSTEIPLSDLKTSLNDLIDLGTGHGWSWPDASSDGVWVRVNSAAADGFGGYNTPWNGFGNAVTKAQANTRLRLKAGDANWTGTINKRLRLDAPLGQVRIGFP